jgi:hypothetical protein
MRLQLAAELAPWRGAVEIGRATLQLVDEVRVINRQPGGLVRYRLKEPGNQCQPLIFW